MVKGVAAGHTLLELVVVLAILGLLVGVTGLAVTREPRSTESRAAQAVHRARAAAIRTGHPVRLRLASGALLFLPDGRALGPGVDPLTGLPHGAQ